MPSIEFQVWCSCGDGLCRQTSDVSGGISVEPCESCLERKRGEGYEDGHAEGYQDGYDEGYQDAVKIEAQANA